MYTVARAAQCQNNEQCEAHGQRQNKKCKGYTVRILLMLLSLLLNIICSVTIIRVLAQRVQRIADKRNDCRRLFTHTFLYCICINIFFRYTYYGSAIKILRRDRIKASREKNCFVSNGPLMRQPQQQQQPQSNISKGTRSVRSALQLDSGPTVHKLYGIRQLDTYNGRAHM